jgi:hypothetical protein
MEQPYARHFTHLLLSTTYIILILQTAKLRLRMGKNCVCVPHASVWPGRDWNEVHLSLEPKFPIHHVATVGQPPLLRGHLITHSHNGFWHSTLHQAL